MDREHIQCDKAELESVGVGTANVEARTSTAVK